MSENYRDVPGWEGIYQVSDQGTVISLDRCVNGRKIQGKRLKNLKCNGTVKVNLCTGTRSISKTFTVGHLVLSAFVSSKEDGQRAKHKDGDQYNNTIENLYWGKLSPNTKKAIP